MFEEEYKYIGAKIIYYRKLQRLTQEELSQKAAISTSYLSRIERGAYNKGVPISTLLRIADALKVNVAKFFDKDV